jgi:dihydrofolate reductase
MAKVLVVNHMTLDGVMQAPGRPQEDTRDGFPYGGWGAAGYDDNLTAKIGERMGAERAFLFGRRTYEQFFSYWPTQVGNPFNEALTNTTKYVASRTLTEPLPWSNSVLLKGDAADAVAELKQQTHDTLVMFGSGVLIGALMAADLIDEYLLMIHPLLLGRGRRLFGPGIHTRLRLVESFTTATGVVVADYEPERA